MSSSVNLSNAVVIKSVKKLKKIGEIHPTWFWKKPFSSLTRKLDFAFGQIELLCGKKSLFCPTTTRISLQLVTKNNFNKILTNNFKPDQNTLSFHPRRSFKFEFRSWQFFIQLLHTFFVVLVVVNVVNWLKQL